MPGMLKNMIEYSYRIATQNDIQAITDIYNAAAIRGGSSADITPRTYEQRKAWVEECRKRNMRKACGIIFADNAGSIALMKRFGFTQFGLMPTAATDSTGTMRDMSYWYLDL